MSRITTGLTAACLGLAVMFTAVPAQAQLGLSKVEFFALQQEMRDRGCGNQTAGGMLNAETQRALRVCADRLGVAADGRTVLHAMNIGFGPNDRFADMQARRNELASAPALVGPTAVRTTTVPVSTTTTTTTTSQPVTTTSESVAMPTAVSDPPRPEDTPRIHAAPTTDAGGQSTGPQTGGAQGTTPQ